MSPNNAILLIDADVLAVGGAATAENKDDDGEIVIGQFEQVATWIDNMVYSIMDTCKSEHVFMFISGSENFRYDIATVKPYKAKRKPKPYHTENAKMYIRSRYDTYVSKGCEADDLLAMSMTSYRKDDVPCILCTVDKDLLQVEGWHYRWEGYNFPEVMPHFVDDLGHLVGEYDEEERFIAKSFKGDGYLWFMSQIITGDTVDNIPGLPRWGPKKAYESLSKLESKAEALQSVISAYQEVYDEQTWEAQLEEQARLVYMIRERDADSPDGLKHWRLEDAKASAAN